MTPRPIPALLAAMLLAACGGGGAGDPQPQTSRWATMDSPAAGYCAELQGRLELRQEPGGEAAYCHLSDGGVIEEWQLYRGRNSL